MTWSVSERRQMLRAKDHPIRIDTSDRAPMSQHRRAGEEGAGALLVAIRPRTLYKIPERLMDDASRQVPAAIRGRADGVTG
jgi:hypothetical protein